MGKNKKIKKIKKETYGYEGWLISDNFLKRVFAVVGYYFTGQIIISFVIFSIGMFFVLLIIFFSWIVNVFSIF